MYESGKVFWMFWMILRCSAFFLFVPSESQKMFMTNFFYIKTDPRAAGWSDRFGKNNDHIFYLVKKIDLLHLTQYYLFL